MAKQRPGFFGRLLAGFRPAAPAAPDTVASPAAPDGETSSVAILQMDLRARDARIAAMQREYETLQQEVLRAAKDAGKEQVEALCKRLSSPLANLAALRALAGDGKTVDVADVLSLVGDVERALAKAGLEQVGRVGEAADFDVATHQRMSGGDVRSGTAVVVRLPGYRLADRVVLKAMVSAKGADDGAGRG